MESYFSQSHGNWELFVSDDGSTDATPDIVREYGDRGKRITLLEGPCRGAAANFLYAARTVETDADFFAWSDSDDVWLPDKLSRAVRRLEELEHTSGHAALYCARTEVVDRNCRFLHYSPLFTRPPEFRNALCQNIGGGNTMAFNRAARELLRSGTFPEVIAHDWWAYMLVTGCGGSIFYDPEPCLLYRQHGENLTGSNTGIRARLFRARRLYDGVAHEWNRGNITALEERRELLTPENAGIFDEFAGAAEGGTLPHRLARFRNSGVRRQQRWQTAALYAVACMRKYP